MRTVGCFSALAGANEPEITHCHCLRPTTKSGEDHPDWLKYNQNQFKPYMDEAIQRLVSAGVSARKISQRFMCVKGNALQTIIETALNNDFATIVVGHRDSVSKAQENFRDRFSEQIIKSLKDMAVWVVN